MVARPSDKHGFPVTQCERADIRMLSTAGEWVCVGSPETANANIKGKKGCVQKKTKKTIQIHRVWIGFDVEKIFVQDTGIGMVPLETQDSRVYLILSVWEECIT
jgi:hypothetical protein